MTKVELAMAHAWGRLPTSATVFCAVSGGLDSMVMLEAAANLRVLRDSGRELVVLHVNHNLRGEESSGDEEFVRSAASRLGLLVKTMRIEWMEERPTQALCREKREAFFRAHLREGDRIFLAHHLDDQAETIMQRLLRGTGVRGLAGMRPESGAKIRPFLAIGRADIEAFAREKNIQWREDSSNQSTKYERNWLRHEILPRLEARRPGFAQRLSALAEEVALERPPMKELSSFAVGEDWRFYRAHELLRAGSGALSEGMKLSRLHTRGLCDLLDKGSGRYEAEGKKFRLSAGILLVGETPFLPSSESVGRGDWVAVSNLLGRWEMRLAPGEKVGFSSFLALGEKTKKEFQRYRVPVFFRELVPLLVRNGKPRALLPMAQQDDIRLELAPLGRWWLERDIS